MDSNTPGGDGHYNQHPGADGDNQDTGMYDDEYYSNGGQTGGTTGGQTGGTTGYSEGGYTNATDGGYTDGGQSTGGFTGGGQSTGMGDDGSEYMGDDDGEEDTPYTSGGQQQQSMGGMGGSRGGSRARAATAAEDDDELGGTTTGGGGSTTGAATPGGDGTGLGDSEFTGETPYLADNNTQQSNSNALQYSVSLTPVQQSLLYMGQQQEQQAQEKKKKETRKKTTTQPKTKGRPIKEVDTFHLPSNPNAPLPDEYKCLCYINGQFLVVHVIGKLTPRQMRPTEVEVCLFNQSQPTNTIPRPYPPETLPVDYAGHEYCYYVHVERWDRRMDQWVTRDRLRSFAELVRFIAPYSFSPQCSGRINPARPGLYVDWRVVALLKTRYPALVYYSMEQFQQVDTKKYHRPGHLDFNPAAQYEITQIPPHQNAYLTTNTPPPNGVQSDWLIPMIVPHPLPIVPILSPGLYENLKLMDEFERMYQDAALETLSLVLSTPLQPPPDDQMDPAFLPNGPQHLATLPSPAADLSNNNSSGKMTRARGKRAGSIEPAQSNSNAPVVHEANSLYTHPDGWRGPRYLVETYEEALLHFGPMEDESEHIANSKFKMGAKVVLGRFNLSPWYYSPYPPHYLQSGTLWCCEFCFSPFNYEDEMVRHQVRCTLRAPPGQEIYRSKENNIEICMFEVDGAKEIVYAENLSYFAKIFLDHKWLWWDCSIFYFYVMCEVTPRGLITLGYFSKEKAYGTKCDNGAINSNNLACILTLPQYQGMAFGKFLISFSYELSRIDQVVGGPERPFSDLGRISYIAQWTENAIKAIYIYVEYRKRHKTMPTIPDLIKIYSQRCYLDLVEVCEPMLELSENYFGQFSISIDEISQITYIVRDDLIDALKENQILQYSPIQHTWCYNLNSIKDVITKAKRRKETQRERLMAKTEEERAQHKSVRLAIPALVRWTKHIQPAPRIASNKKNQHQDDDDDEIVEPQRKAPRQGRVTRGNPGNR